MGINESKRRINYSSEPRQTRAYLTELEDWLNRSKIGKDFQGWITGDVGDRGRQAYAGNSIWQKETIFRALGHGAIDMRELLWDREELSAARYMDRNYLYLAMSPQWEGAVITQYMGKIIETSTRFDGDFSDNVVRDMFRSARKKAMDEGISGRGLFLVATDLYFLKRGRGSEGGTAEMACRVLSTNPEDMDYRNVDLLWRIIRRVKSYECSR